MAETHLYTSDAEWVQAVVSAISAAIQEKQQKNEVFRIALSGGSTPAPIYRALSEIKSIDWSLVEVFLVDERMVPAEGQHSNQRMINESLIDRLPVKPARWVFFNTSGTEQEAVDDYEKKLKGDQNPLFDLVLLGIGGDGHTASLFPHHPLLEENKHLAGRSQTDVFDVRERLTLTYPALEGASRIFFLLKGQHKREIVQKLEQSDPHDRSLPAARLYHLKKSELFFLTEH